MLAVGFHNAWNAFKPVKCMAVGGAENEWNSTLLQFGCNAKGKVSVEVNIKHHAIKPWLPDFLFGGGNGAGCSRDNPTKTLHHVVSRHRDYEVILDNEDARSLKMHISTVLLMPRLSAILVIAVTTYWLFPIPNKMNSHAR